MREDSGQGAAAGAFDVHEVGVWGLNKSLELVEVFLIVIRWVEKVNSLWVHPTESRPRPSKCQDTKPEILMIKYIITFA